MTGRGYAPEVDNATQLFTVRDPRVGGVSGFPLVPVICYILQSDIRSPREQQVDLIRSEKAVPHLFLNGQEVSGGKGTLRKGDNRLVLVFKSLFPARRFSMFSSDHAGCFLRITRPGTFERITDIRFAPPRR